MDVSLSDLKTFREVARLGTVSAAARSLNLSQPTVSWTVKKLEDQFGSALFQRTNKGMSLTRAGQSLAERAETLMQHFLSLRDEIKADTEEIRGSYSLGVFAILGSFTLPRFCPSLLEAHPHLDLNLFHDLSRNIAEKVIKGRLDFGIVVNPPQHDDLVIHELYSDEIKFWTRRQPSSLQDPQSDHSVLWVHPNLRQNKDLLRQAREGQLFNFKRICYSTDLLVILHMIASGCGIGLLPETIARAYGGSPLMALEGSPIYHDAICLIYRHDLEKTRAAETIKNAILAANYEDAWNMATNH